MNVLVRPSVISRNLTFLSERPNMPTNKPFCTHKLFFTQGAQSVDCVPKEQPMQIRPCWVVGDDGPNGQMRKAGPPTAVEPYMVGPIDPTYHKPCPVVTLKPVGIRSVKMGLPAFSSLG